MEQRLLTTAEAGGILRVSTDTVLRMLERGDLRGFRSAKTTRVFADSVELLLGQPIEALETATG